jgi:GT2 family glycosyltransferase
VEQVGMHTHPGIESTGNRATVTVVVSPRERFSAAQRSFESLMEDTSYPFDLVYVDGRSPRSLQRYLERQRRHRPFTLVRTERYLTPNEARNIGLRHVTTKYVVFTDNDVLFSKGWLERLVACAEETDAAIVGPLYLEGESPADIIHMAGGDAGIITRPDGKRVLYEKHRFAGIPLAAVQESCCRTPVDLLEFHCLLVARKWLDRIGSFDENLRSVSEHVDFCMLARTRGANIYFEPRSVIRYLRPPKLERSDIVYFMLRWSEAWTRMSIDHLVQKWSLTADVPTNYGVVEFGRSHRRLLMAPAIANAARFGRYPERLVQRYISALEVAFNRYALPLLLRATRAQ